MEINAVQPVRLCIFSNDLFGFPFSSFSLSGQPVKYLNAQRAQFYQARMKNQIVSDKMKNASSAGKEKRNLPVAQQGGTDGERKGRFCSFGESCH